MFSSFQNTQNLHKFLHKQFKYFFLAAFRLLHETVVCERASSNVTVILNRVYDFKSFIKRNEENDKNKYFQINTLKSHILAFSVEKRHAGLY